MKIAALALIMAAPSIAQAPPTKVMTDFPQACEIMCAGNDDAVVVCLGSDGKKRGIAAGKCERAVRFIRVNHAY